MSRAGIIAALVYVIPATSLLVNESRYPPGGWINLKSMLPAILTLPVGLPMALLGFEPDLTRTTNVVLMVAACTCLVYFVTAAIANWIISR